MFGLLHRPEQRSERGTAALDHQHSRCALACAQATTTNQHSVMATPDLFTQGSEQCRPLTAGSGVRPPVQRTAAMPIAHHHGDPAVPLPPCHKTHPTMKTILNNFRRDKLDAGDDHTLGALRRPAHRPRPEVPRQGRNSLPRRPRMIANYTEWTTMNASEKVQAVVTEFWSRNGESYDTHPTSVLHIGDAAELWRRTWASGLPTPPADVLDVGTGTGQVAMELWRLGHRVTGIDLAEEMLDLARTKARKAENPPVFTVGDAVTPPFPDASFDAITARYVLWTLREPHRTLSNWRQLLRPGGRIAIVDGAWNDTYISTYDQNTMNALTLAGASSAEAYTAAIEGAGFTDVTVRELTELYEIELRHSTETNGVDRPEVHLQYLITAAR